MIELIENDWQPLATAPRDGTIVHLGDLIDGVPHAEAFMRWNPERRNPLVGDVVGMWETIYGDCTWSEHIPDGAPTHWKRHYMH